MSNKIDLKQFEEYIVFEEPIPYKELLIYPVTVKDCMRFQFASNCLIISKNRIPDVKIIQMSYLDFIFYLSEQNEDSQVYLFMLQEIFRICMNIKSEDLYTIKDDKGRRSLFINDQVYDRYDFDNIKNIICHQNNIELPNEHADPKFEQAMKEMREYKNKNSKVCSFERQMMWIMRDLGINFDEVKKLSIRKFFMALENIDKILHYQILMTAKMGGMVEFKTDPDHWMNESVVDEGLIDFDEFKSKIK